MTCDILVIEDMINKDLKDIKIYIFFKKNLLSSGEILKILFINYFFSNKDLNVNVKVGVCLDQYPKFQIGTTKEFLDPINKFEV